MLPAHVPYYTTSATSHRMNIKNALAIAKVPCIPSHLNSPLFTHKIVPTVCRLSRLNNNNISQCKKRSNLAKGTWVRCGRRRGSCAPWHGRKISFPEQGFLYTKQQRQWQSSVRNKICEYAIKSIAGKASKRMRKRRECVTRPIQQVTHESTNH